MVEPGLRMCGYSALCLRRLWILTANRHFNGQPGYIDFLGSIYIFRGVIVNIKIPAASESSEFKSVEELPGADTVKLFLRI